MDAHQENRVLAIGLIRKAATLLGEAGDPQGAAAVFATIDMILAARPLDQPEMDPDLAAIVAAAPLPSTP